MAALAEAEDAAESIGSNLAEAVVGPVASFAFGQLLSATGITTDSQAQMSAQLDAIISAIATLQTTIDAFRTAFDSAITQVNYDVVAQPLDDLIATNTTLGGLFKDLADRDPGDTDGIANAKKLIRAEMDKSIADAPATWNNALAGAAGTTSVLTAWNRVVHTHYEFFGPDATNAIQKHWAYLDSQQAQAVMHCVEYLNDQGDHEGAVRTLADWQTNRTAQLGLLRGMRDAVDNFQWANPTDKTVSTVSTPVKSLPPNVVITTVPDGIRMFCLIISAWVQHGESDDVSTFNGGLSPLENAVHWQTGCWNWSVMPIPELIDALNHFGGNVGGGGADYFADALKQHGFTVPDGLRLWSDVTRDAYGNPQNQDGYYGTRSIFVDGDSWWNPSTNWGDNACILFQRSLDSGEADNYWYANG